MKRLFSTILILLLFATNTFAGSGISIIRDTEIENFLREITTPILRSAGLNPQDIKFYIVNDNNINAFVMGGQNIFVNTGTITSFDTPDAVLGIIAHETGHIAAGHLARFNEQIKSISAVSIGAILFGIGTMLVGIPGVGQAIIFGSIQVQQQNVLKYNRGQEEVADDLATKYLNDNQLSSVALLHSMKQFYISELRLSNDMEYYSTHPLSRNRKQFIENKMKNESYNNDEFNKKYKNKFNFIKAKISAYNKTPKPNLESGSDYEKYAKAITDMNSNNFNQALENVDYLIKKYKDNPYFYELKGDIYLKNNDVNKALSNYTKADKIIKNNTLIKKMIAFIIIKYDQKNMYKTAIENLNYVIQNDPDDNTAIKLLAEVYHNNGNFALSYLTLAKYYDSIGDTKKAINYLDLAQKNTTDGNILNRIEDLRLTINNNRD